MREWSYWTRNKLEILAGYLPAFNRASQRSSERVYIDLMAGQPMNIDKATGEAFDGSARLALSASPPFTRLAFCEMPDVAKELDADLRARFPSRHDFKVYPGDCNETIDDVLMDLAAYRWAPIFVFVDQHAAEIHWATIAKVASFRRAKLSRKAEMWMLMSPAEIARGVAGSNKIVFAERVDALYGTDDWRRIQAARDGDLITAADYRDEMVNLMRWRLQRILGYKITARIPMRMLNGMTLYDMVFATDHPVGDKIMTDLYSRAAEREPRMRREAIANIKRERDLKKGQDALFEIEADDVALESFTWEASTCWNPASSAWWSRSS